MPARVFAGGFRSRLELAVQAEDSKLSEPPLEATLRSRCHCGKCSFHALARSPDMQSPPAAIRCHCKACRRYHTSAFGAYTFVARTDIPEDISSLPVRTFSEQCQQLGAVNRVFCNECACPIATLPLEGPLAGNALLALGSVRDFSIPVALAMHWQHNYVEWQKSEASWWFTAVPNRSAKAQARVLRGGCACGGCRYEAVSEELQVQHCYCHLCRRLSGSVCQTWVPVMKSGWRWTNSEHLCLIRTTSHGQRHMCKKCASTLTIVYDNAQDEVWSAAGTFDDDCLDMEVSRGIHICCALMQPWYSLPLDGLPRFSQAS